MYMPGHFEESRIDVLHALVRGHPLATWVVQGADGLNVNHVPFLVDATRGEHGTLVGHVARANPVWQRLGPSIAVFQGPQAYVSPNFYPSKRDHGKVVPTWNYAVVHAHGKPEPLAAESLPAHIAQLTEVFERGAWQATPQKVATLAPGVVGFRLKPQRIEVKVKMNQNRTAADRAKVVDHLRATGREEDAAVADWIVVGQPSG